VNWVVFLLSAGALVLSAAGVTFARYSDSFLLSVLPIGLALCLCIEAGRHWT
jgi:hypothetical protein